MNRNKLNILITGARGFIGRNLVEYLSKAQHEDYSLYYPYHKELELLDTKKVSEFIADNNIDIIVHCASIGGSRKFTHYDSGTDVVYNNLRMFFNLASTLIPEKRMIFLGSGAEYDIRYYKPKMPEDYFGTHIPEDVYGFSKYVCSKYIENSKNIINMRLFGVFGKYEDYEYRFISNAIVKNILGLPIIINQNACLDYLYVDNLVRIIEYFIRHKGKHNFYNVTTGNAVDLASIAGEINKIADRPSKIIIKNQGLDTEYTGDNTRLLEEWKDSKFTALKESLRELYAWYKQNITKIDKQVIEKDELLKYCRVK